MISSRHGSVSLNGLRFICETASLKVQHRAENYNRVGRFFSRFSRGGRKLRGGARSALRLSKRREKRLASSGRRHLLWLCTIALLNRPTFPVVLIEP
jgi:hypothetical protein